MIDVGKKGRELPRAQARANIDEAGFRRCAALPCRTYHSPHLIRNLKNEFYCLPED